MATIDKINNEVLRDAGLALMRENGKPLTKRPSRGGSMLHSMPNGESVRVRTTNDHLLVVVADRPTPDANLNIQGTDWLLIVMPEVERTEGPVIAYLVPGRVVEEAVRTSHRAWLSSNPNTKGNNTTWTLRFDSSPSGMASRQDKQGYFEKWAKYRLEGEISTKDITGASAGRYREPGSIQAEVEVARQHIARAASVQPEAVKISIDFVT